MESADQILATDWILEQFAGRKRCTDTTRVKCCLNATSSAMYLSVINILMNGLSVIDGSAPYGRLMPSDAV